VLCEATLGLKFGNRAWSQTMAKKIMIICSSPRKKGNTNTVVNWVAESAKAEGAEIEIVDCARMKYKTNGCTACMSCQNSPKYECVIKDEASVIIKRIPQFDVLVFASPIYWFGVNAQLKLLLDRTFALVKFDPKTGDPIENKTSGQNTLCVIATGGGPLNAGLKHVDDTFKAAAKFMKCRYRSLLVPNAPTDPVELGKDNKIKEKAYALGKKLATA
jgi:multimeric flavodoxin WrbA